MGLSYGFIVINHERLKSLFPAPTTSELAVEEEEGGRYISAVFSATEMEEENSGFRRTGKEEEEEELEAEEKGKTRDAAGPLGK